MVAEVRKMRDEIKWFASSPRELEQFRGKHIALLGKRIVASGESAKEVLEKSKKRYPSKIPVLTYLPRRGTLIL